MIRRAPQGAIHPAAGSSRPGPQPEKLAGKPSGEVSPERERRPGRETGTAQPELERNAPSLSTAPSARSLYSGQAEARRLLANVDIFELFGRWVQDEITRALPDYWLRRAAVFDDVPDEITARNCRRHAALLRSQLNGTDLLDELAGVA